MIFVRSAQRFALLVALVASPITAQQPRANTGNSPIRPTVTRRFYRVRIGESYDELPFKCYSSWVMCQGEVQGKMVSVILVGQFVASISVMYSWTDFLGVEHGTGAVPLLAALRENSFAFSKEEFKLAQTLSGNGLVEWIDVENKVIYQPSSDGPEMVAKAIYAPVDSPVLKEAVRTPELDAQAHKMYLALKAEQPPVGVGAR